MAARHFCFTYNNPPFTHNDLPIHDHERYCIFQLESGESGTLHYQGYVEYNRPVRVSSIQAIWPGVHVERRLGSRDQARDYSRKEDTRVEGPWERGAWSDGGQGHRTDISHAVSTLVAHGVKRVAKDHPEAFVKYHRGFRALAAELEENPKDDAFTPRYWQQSLLDAIAPSPDDRTIFWVTDTHGGKGKSRLAKHLVLSHGAVHLEGRIQDMAYAYNKEPIALFDVSRAAAEHSDHLYSMAEKLKNGVVVSTKYESVQKIFSPPHVIFFSNQSWDRSKFTNDRVIEFDLNNPELQAP